MPGKCEQVTYNPVLRALPVDPQGQRKCGTHVFVKVIRIAFLGTNLSLSGKQSCCAVTFNEAVVKCDICPASCHELSTNDSRVDSTCSLFGFFGTGNFSGNQRLLYPGNVDISKSLNFRPHFVR